MSGKPTPGPWERKSMCVFATKHGNLVMAADGDFGENGISFEEAVANAGLIAEAGTVFHETGLAPQQLRAAWDEARSMLLGAECAEQSLAKENEQLREQRDELLAALQFVDLRLSQVQPGHGTRANDLVDHLRPPIRAAIAKVEGLL